MVRRTLVGASLIVVIAGFIVPGVSGAMTHSKVGPHQYFAGSVNGSFGAPVPAAIKVVCPGPTRLGQTGHPLSGQTVEVGMAISTFWNWGYTGKNASSIAVFFGPPPPSVAGPGQVTFTRYGVSKAIPTSLNLPCSGSGAVTFVPFPESPPTSRSESVAVDFENVAATSAP